MITPVTCTTCSYPLGDVAILFEMARQALTRQALERGDLAPKMLLVSGEQVVLGPVLDALGVSSDCCRLHLMSTVWFHVEY
jgi:DNA-directed RNA polymerase subunit N (RpoN/RPB10)